MNIKLHNKFEIEIISNDDTVKGSYVSYNTVKNFVAQRFNAKNCISLSGIYFGNGTSVDVTTSTLTSYLGACTGVTTTDSYDSDNHIFTRKLVGTIEPDVFNDTPISELGVGWDQNYICTHSLITDSLGSPISITKTSSEKIKITATVYITFVGMPEGTWVSSYWIELIKDYFSSTNAFSSNAIRYGFFSNSDPHGNVDDKLNVYTKPLGGTSATRILGGDLTIGVSNFNGKYITHIGIQDYVYNSSGSDRYPAAMSFPLRNLESFKNFTVKDIPVGTGDGVKDTFDIPTYFTNSTDKITVKVDGSPMGTVHPKCTLAIETRPSVARMYYNGIAYGAKNYQKIVDGKVKIVGTSELTPIIIDSLTPTNLPPSGDHTAAALSPFNDKYGVCITSARYSSTWYKGTIIRRNNDGSYTHLSPEIRSSSTYSVNCSAYPHPTDTEKFAILNGTYLTFYTVTGDTLEVGKGATVGESVYAYPTSAPVFYSGKTVSTIDWEQMDVVQVTISTPSDYGSKICVLKKDTYAYITNNNRAAVIVCDSAWNPMTEHRTGVLSGTISSIRYAGLNCFYLSSGASGTEGVYEYGIDPDGTIHYLTSATYTDTYFGSNPDYKLFEGIVKDHYMYYKVKFDTPIEQGKVITADLTPTGLYKTEDWVLDIKIGFNVSADS